jgi:hypothetical protein
MAVNKPENEQGQQQTTMGQAFGNAQQSRQQEQPGGQQGGYQARPKRQGLGDIWSSAPNAMSRSPESDIISTLSTALRDEYNKSVRADFIVTLVPIDLDTTRTLEKSAIVVCVESKQIPELGVAYHTLILEGSSEPVQNITQQIGNNPIEITRTTGDVYTPVYQAEVREFVQRQFPGKDLHSVDAEVVWADFDVTNKKRVYNLAANAVLAGSNELGRLAGSQDIELGNIEQDSSLTVQATFGNAPTEDILGAPIRSDIVIDFRIGGQPVPGQQGITSRVKPLARVSLFADLVWSPVVSQQQAYGMWVPAAQQQQSPDAFRKYVPRLIITDLDSQAVLSLRAQLLGLVTAFSLRENNGWVETFRPSPITQDGQDFRDIGAVGIEANFEGNSNGIGSRIDTKADSFQRSQHQPGDFLLRLVGSVFQPKLLLSMDIPEAAPSTWVSSVFAAAGETGNPASVVASNYIISEANKLTNGRLANYLAPNTRIIVDENNRIHLGYFIGRDGQKHDLREVDYLYVLNAMGERDPEVPREWSDSFARADVPLEVRLAKRKQIIEGILGKQNVHITGFARRVTFEPEFVNALTQAVKDVGLQVRTIAPYVDLQGYERAVNPYVAHAALDAMGYQSGVFNRGYQGQPQGNFGNRQGFSRWG